MSLEPFKFVVTVVLLEKDENGAILGERSAEPVALYSVAKLEEWAQTFSERLAEQVPISSGTAEPD